MPQPDPLAHLTPEQRKMFVEAQNELQSMLAPWFVKYGSLFDPQALVYSLMVSVARVAHSVTPPIDAQQWAYAAATCFHVAFVLNQQAAADDSAKRAILANG